MSYYQILPHVADVRLKIGAKSLPALFRAGLLAMNKVLKKNFYHPAGRRLVRVKINLRAADSTILLVDFLSAALTLSYAKRAVFYRVKFVILTSTVLRAELFGSTVDTFAKDIKAVTYHQAEIIKNQSGNLETIIVLDI